MFMTKTIIQVDTFFMIHIVKENRDGTYDTPFQAVESV